jgi:hypothetical protein
LKDARIQKFGGPCVCASRSVSRAHALLRSVCVCVCVYGPAYVTMTTTGGLLWTFTFHKPGGGEGSLDKLGNSKLLCSVQLLSQTKQALPPSLHWLFCETAYKPVTKKKKVGQDFIGHTTVKLHTALYCTFASCRTLLFHFHFSFPSFVRLIDVFLKHFQCSQHFVAV